jgi:hypothetical protein
MGGEANTDGWGRSYWGQADWGDTNVVETGWGRRTWGYQASFTARGCLIYNTTSITGFTTNRAVCAINFGSDKTVTSGTFTIQFPAQTAGNAIIQIA